MFVEQLEAVARCILAQCERVRSDGPESIGDDAILKVLNDFTDEAITISPESQQEITPSLSPAWKDTIAAVIKLFKLFNLTATCPTATAPTICPTATAPIPAATAPTATAPTATAPTATAPIATAPTATAPTATAPTATTPSVATTATPATTPVAIPPSNTPPEKKSRKGKNTDLHEVISENLETWRDSPGTLFNQGSISLQYLCSYIQDVSDSAILNTLRLRFAKRMLYLQRKLWSRKAIKQCSQHLKAENVVWNEDTFGRWIREGRTYELFVERWGHGALLATDLTATQAQRFPHKDNQRRKSLLDALESGGIKKLAATYDATSTALWTYFDGVSVVDKFVSDNTTSPMTARKRKNSQTSTHQDRRPFCIDQTPAEFAQQSELVSSPVTTQIGDVAEREAARTGRFATRDAGGREGSRLEVENRQWSSPTAPAQYQPVAEPSPRSSSSSLDRAFTEDDCQRPLSCGTDRSAYSDHPNDRIDERQSPRTHQRVSSHSPTTHSVPATAAVQSHIAEPPASNPRSRSQSHVPSQEPAASPQHDRLLELSPTHQPKLPSPEPREEAKTNDSGLGSAQQPSTQDLSSVQPHGLEPISGAIETSCYPQHGNPPPHPPQTSPDTVIQRHETGVSSSEPWKKPGWVTSLQGQQASTVGSPPPVHQQPYQPEHPEVTSYLDQLVNPNEPYYVNEEPSQATDVDWDSLRWDAVVGRQDVSTDDLFTFLGLDLVS